MPIGTRHGAAAIAAVTFVLAGLLAAAGIALAAGPPFPSQAAGRSVYDPDGMLAPATVQTAESAAAALLGATGLQPVIYVERSPVALSAAQAGRNADALVSQWQIGRGLVMLVDVNGNRCGGQIVLRRGAQVDEAEVSDTALGSIADTVRGTLNACDPDTAVLVGLSNLTVTLITISGARASAVASPAASGATNSFGASPSPAASQRPGSSVPAGPPFPDPTPGQYVYDQAGVFRPDTIAKVQAQIQSIRDRTGAEIVVYSQVVGFEDSSDAEAHAQALMDQWGVGRKGFDDGLVILFDLQSNRIHGEIQLYAGPGYRAAFLSNDERQAIFENDMLPRLKEADLDGALLVALDKVDANATPEHAATLNRARVLNAVIGLVGAPLALVLFGAWPVWWWLRFGRDPGYLDDPSILMPAPPPDLTAATGALVFDGASSRHTLTTAMLDLASRDELAFRPEHHLLAKDKVSIEIRKPNENDPQIGLNRRKPISPAETFARTALAGLAEPDATGARLVDSTALLKFGPKVSDFDDRLELYATQKGWFREKPKSAMTRWYTRGGLEAIGGGVLIFVGANLPSDGLVVIGAAILAAGLFTLVVARVMPARTLAGATIRAMLAAYRRTLEKTLVQSRSMDQVVASKALPWLETPDQAVVWGVALGLRKDVEDVLERTASDIQHGRADPSVHYLPLWYGASGWGGGGSGVGGGGGIAPGLFSGSAIPNFGSMMAAIGTVGNSPSSSGGGFGGGGSGGGGGGAGGGF